MSVVPAGTPVFAAPGLPPRRGVGDDEGVAGRDRLGVGDGCADALAQPADGGVATEPAHAPDDREFNGDPVTQPPLGTDPDPGADPGPDPAADPDGDPLAQPAAGRPGAPNAAPPPT